MCLFYLVTTNCVVIKQLVMCRLYIMHCIFKTVITMLLLIQVYKFHDLLWLMVVCFMVKLLFSINWVEIIINANFIIWGTVIPLSVYNSIKKALIVFCMGRLLNSVEFKNRSMTCSMLYLLEIFKLYILIEKVIYWTKFDTN